MDVEKPWTGRICLRAYDQKPIEQRNSQLQEAINVANAQMAEVTRSPRNPYHRGCHYEDGTSVHMKAVYCRPIYPPRSGVIVRRNCP